MEKRTETIRLYPYDTDIPSKIERGVERVVCICDTTNGPISTSLPSYEDSEVTYHFKNTGSSEVEISAINGQTIDGLSSITLAENGSCIIISHVLGFALMVSEVNGPPKYGSEVEVKRIDDSDSPYDLTTTDYVLYCDTENGAITVNLPAGVEGIGYRIINVTNSNLVTVVPNGTDLLDGVNASKSFSRGVLDLVYETTEGWW